MAHTFIVGPNLLHFVIRISGHCRFGYFRVYREYGRHSATFHCGCSSRRGCRWRQDLWGGTVVVTGTESVVVGSSLIDET
jgi:hypothetical protein